MVPSLRTRRDDLRGRVGGGPCERSDCKDESDVREGVRRGGEGKPAMSGNVIMEPAGARTRTECWARRRGLCDGVGGAESDDARDGRCLVGGWA